MNTLTPGRVEEAFAAIAAAQGARSRRAKTAALGALLSDAGPLEARYLIRVMTADMRVGLRAGLLLEAVTASSGWDPAVPTGAAPSRFPP